jgi:hypothetical protein
MVVVVRQRDESAMSLHAASVATSRVSRRGGGVTRGERFRTRPQRRR